jgi:hypothetical protein
MAGFAGNGGILDAMLAARQMHQLQQMGMFSIEEPLDTPRAKQERRDARMQLKAAREERSRQRKTARLDRQSRAKEQANHRKVAESKTEEK